MNNVAEFKKSDKKQEPPSHPPLINLPPVTKYMLILMIGIFIVTSYILSADERYLVFLKYGFVPNDWSGIDTHTDNYFAWYTPFTLVTYMLLHANLVHIIMNGTMLMAFGAGVERWMGGKRYILFFLLCGIISALIEFAVHPASPFPVVGASGGLSGLFAAVLVLLQRQGQLKTGRYGIWPFAALWIGIAVVFGLVGENMAGGPIAWVAHLGGFVGGFLLLKLPYFKAPL